MCICNYVNYVSTGEVVRSPVIGQLPDVNTGNQTKPIAAWSLFHTAISPVPFYLVLAVWNSVCGGEQAGLELAEILLPLPHKCWN